MSENPLTRFTNLKSLPQWKKEMLAAYRKAESKTRHDFIGLYVKLKQIFRNYYNQGMVEEGEHFYMEIGALVPYKEVFFEEGSELCLINDTTNQKSLVISRADLDKERKTLGAQEQLCSCMGVNIGRRYPKELVEYLKGIQPMQMIAFEEGSWYICVYNSGLTLNMLEVFNGDITDLSMEKIDYSFDNKVSIDLSDKHSIQRFYKKNFKKLTRSVEGKVLDIAKAREVTSSLYDDLSKVRKKEVKFGPLALKAKKSIFEKGRILWYNDGKRVSSDEVNWLVAYLDSTPMKISYVRNKKTSLKAIEDEAFAQDVEELIKSQKLIMALDVMKRYVIKHKGELTIKIDVYEKDVRDGFVAASYLMIVDDNQIKILKKTYENNDFNSKCEIVMRVGESELYELFKEKYEKDCSIVVGRALTEMGNIE